MELGAYKTDPDKTTNGVWISIEEKTRVKLARFGNPKMMECYKQYPRAIRDRIDQGLADDEAAVKVTCEVMSKTILLDWEGLKMEGKDLPYSQENALHILKTYDLFRELIWSLSHDTSQFHDANVEAATKNSSSDSDTNSSTT